MAGDGAGGEDAGGRVLRQVGLGGLVPAGLRPAWSSSEVAGTDPPETARRSQLSPCSVSGTIRPSLSISATTTPFTCLRPIARTTAAPRSSPMPALCKFAISACPTPSRRASTTATISTRRP